MTDPERASAKPPSATAARPVRGPMHLMVRVFGGLLGLGLAVALSVLLLVGVALAVAYPNLPDISGLTDYRPKLPLRVVAYQVAVIGCMACGLSAGALGIGARFADYAEDNPGKLVEMNDLLARLAPMHRDIVTL